MMAKFILPAGKVRETGLRELYRMNITTPRCFRIWTDWRARWPTNWNSIGPTIRAPWNPSMAEE